MIVLLGAVLIAALAVIAVQRLVWPAFEGPPTCTFLNDAGNRFDMTPEQARNAATIVSVARRRDLPDRAQVIGVATALQESRLLNLTGGDRDSVGLFQQRPSQGWGTAEQLRDPVYASGRFYEGLTKIDGWERLPLTVAAQAVQRSNFPHAYAQHEFQATVLASALDGRAPDRVVCRLREQQTHTAREHVAEVLRAEAGITAEVSATGLIVHGQDRREAAEAAAWAVACAQQYGVTQVRRGDRIWQRGSDDAALTWAQAAPEDRLADTEVRISLPGA